MRKGLVVRKTIFVAGLVGGFVLGIRATAEAVKSGRIWLENGQLVTRRPCRGCC